MSSMKLSRRAFNGLVAAAPFVSMAHAQGNYPSKAITFVSPFAASGASDFAARSVAERLSQSLGQPVVVENRPGANGIVGTAMVAKDAPDGYNLLLTLAATMGINPGLYKAATYKPEDFTHVGLMLKQPYLIAANAQLGVNTIDDLVKLAKERGDRKLSFATGSASHYLAGLLLQKEAGIELIHVPYNSTGIAMPDVLSGRVDLIILAAFTALPFLDQIKGLAATSSKRAVVAPDIPTMVESGFPNYVVEGWYGISGPAGMPPEVVETLNKALVPIINDPELGKEFEKRGLEVASSTPEEFTAFVRQEYDLWTRIIKEAGIEPT